MQYKLGGLAPEDGIFKGHPALVKTAKVMNSKYGAVNPKNGKTLTKKQ